MIIGIGSDITDIRRIASSLDRYGERFIKRIFTEIRHDVDRAKSRPDLTELYRRAGYLITLIHTPFMDEKFGTAAKALRDAGEEEFQRTIRTINARAEEIGTEADYDEEWGH